MTDSALAAALRQQLSERDFPEWEEEKRFHPTRLWRFDFAWPAQRVACEVEGGTGIHGRHNRPEDFIADCEKYNEAAANGWTVIRVTAEHINSGRAVEWLQRVLACGKVPF
jgi:very-short-patch-repair endonuclease